MTSAHTFALAGLLLALAATTGGFGGFLLAVVLAAAGVGLGLARDGHVDLGALLRGGRDRG